MGLSLLLISSNKKEEEILKMFFEQFKYKVIVSKPSHANYIKTLQYSPAVIFIDMPTKYTDHLNFTRLVSKNKRSNKIPIIAYGDHTSKSVLDTFSASGIKKFYRRPLKTSIIIKDMSALIQKTGRRVEKIEDDVSDRKQDFAIILDKSESPLKKIEIMTKYIKQMLAFPFTVAKILKITQSEDTGADDLAKAIQADPVVVTSMLRVANSVFFASRHNRISEIKEAIVRIGFTGTKNIAMGMMVMKLFSNEQKNIGFDRVEFWYHSLACGIVAEQLAKNVQYPSPEKAFMAGLLHDFGIIILDEFFGEIFNSIMEETTKYGKQFIATEEKILGFNHGDISKTLFEHWKIPDDVIFSVVNYQNYSSLDNTTDKRLLQLTTFVGMAHIIVKSVLIGKECDIYVEPIPNKAFELIKFPVGLRDIFWDQVNVQLNAYNSFFNIDKRTFPLVIKDIEDSDKINIATVSRQNMLFNSVDEYLKKQGYSVSPVMSVAEIDGFDTPADLVIVYARDNDTIKDIKNYLSVIKSVSVEDMDPENPEYLPVIVFCGKNAEMLGEETNEKLIILKNSFDLQNIDIAIERILSGEPWEDRIINDDLELNIEKVENGITIVKIEGAVNINNMMELTKKIMEILNDPEEPVNNLAVNMKSVGVIDSNGVKFFVNINKRISQSGGRFCMYNVRKKIEDTLKSTEISKNVGIVKDEKSLNEFFAS